MTLSAAGTQLALANERLHPIRVPEVLAAPTTHEAKLQRPRSAACGGQFIGPAG